MSSGISVIIAAYNRDALFKLCLESLAEQSFRDFELIIADDGSGPGIKKIADSFRDRMNIVHIWQEDKDFRKTLAINKAVRIAAGDKLYFFDADTIAHPDYIKNSHDHICERQYMVTRSVLLSEKISSYILENRIPAGDIFKGSVKWKIMKDGFFGETRFCTYGIVMPRSLAAAAQVFKKNSNMLGRCWAVHRNDYTRVNGYNNDFIGAYCEDSELDARLGNAGIKRKLATNEAVSLHFPHGKSAYSGANAVRLEEVLRSSSIICANGLGEINEKDIIILK